MIFTSKAAESRDSILTTRVGTVLLKNPVMLASGTAGHSTEMSSFIDLSAVGAVVVKSLSIFPWKGNSAPRVHETPAGMINSVGLQGPGLGKWVEKEMPALIESGADIVVSIWGRSIEDYEAAAEFCRDLPSQIIAIEVNVSCPNVEDRGRIFAHSSSMTRSVLAATESVNRPRWAKLSPNTTDLVEIAIAAVDGGADALTLVNTLLGMVIDIETGSPLLGAGGGGLSGPAIRPVAVRSVFDVRRALPDIPIIGVGGIASSAHALEFMMAGANAIQIGTANFANPRISRKVIKDLHRWCQKNSIEEIAAIVGKSQAGDDTKIWDT